jgi:hypothetical protein
LLRQHTQAVLVKIAKSLSVACAPTFMARVIAPGRPWPVQAWRSRARHLKSVRLTLARGIPKLHHLDTLTPVVNHVDDPMVPMNNSVNSAAMNEARPVNPKNATVVGVKTLSANQPGAMVPVRKIE